MTHKQRPPSEELLLETEKLPKPSRRSVWALIGAAVLIIVLAIILFGQKDDQEFSTLQTSCDPARTHTLVADGGRTLVLISGGRQTAVEDRAVTNCLVQELKMPVAVKIQIEETRALDGRQQAAWDGYSASWTYHPDSGLGMIVQKK